MGQVWHREKVGAPVKGSNSTHPTADTGPIIDQSRNMHTMLHDVFDMHEVGENNGEPHIEMLADVENVHREVDQESAQKYYNLLKKADNPLQYKTKHSKLSVVVHLYMLELVAYINTSGRAKQTGAQ